MVFIQSAAWPLSGLIVGLTAAAHNTLPHMAKSPDSSSKDKPGNSRIAEHKKALYNYHIEERHEAGMVLQGWEVKALREGKVQITDGYVLIRDGELFLLGCQINPVRTTSTHVSADAARTKKLLLHKEEIRRLVGKVEQKGHTLVPLNLHWKNGKVKCEIALAKGKAEHDKRDTIKDREGKREVERALKARSR
jgi:SsrA-binding protein